MLNGQDIKGFVMSPVNESGEFEASRKSVMIRGWIWGSEDIWFSYRKRNAAIL